jgi:hypothetical protein
LILHLNPIQIEFFLPIWTVFALKLLIN